MANIPNSYLKPDPNINLRDFQHAARLFTDDNLRLAPKTKFLFHVAFSINPGALRDISLVQRHRNEINMLVKTADLPNFQIQTEMLNQYNRKRNVQTTHKPQPLTIKFHDDNMGLINHVWQNYYSYYYADSISALVPGAYLGTATRNFDYTRTRYGLDNRSLVPFFNYIKIYHMARHEFVSYTLHNPIITQWNHSSVDYSSNTLHDNSMQVAYEAVSYGAGKVIPGDPEGFALEHYDQTPSPLQNTNEIPSNSPSFANNQNVSLTASEYITNLTETINTYQNTKELANSGTSGVLTSPATSQNGVSGIQGLIFPVTSAISSANNIVATISKLF
jgi:hypothetical protein